MSLPYQSWKAVGLNNLLPTVARQSNTQGLYVYLSHLVSIPLVDEDTGRNG